MVAVLLGCASFWFLDDDHSFILDEHHYYIPEDIVLFAH
jgi:hypothetical protein